MPTYTYPTASHFRPSRIEWARRTNVVINPSNFDGSTEIKVLPGSRWVCNLSYPGARAKSEEAAAREAFWSKVGGPENLVAMWHPLRPVPRGTMRGSPTISGSIARGATVLTIAASAGETLEHSDVVKANGMLFQVVMPATANGSGAMSVSVAPPARKTISNGTAIVWDQPTATFFVPGEVRIPYDAQTGAQMPFSVEMVEVWES